MKPVLIVEGKQMNVYAAFYREGKLNNVSVVDKSGVTTSYHDIKENPNGYIEKPLQIDFDKFLKWEGKHDDIIDAIKKRIEAKEERVIELAQDFIAAYIDEELVFPEVEIKSLKNEYCKLQASLNGLYEALDIVHELGGVNNGKI